MWEKLFSMLSNTVDENKPADRANSPNRPSDKALFADDNSLLHTCNILLEVHLSLTL